VDLKFGTLPNFTIWRRVIRFTLWPL
jgi:hypothetical protein